MINRRDLIKKIICGGVLTGLTNTQLLLAEAEAFMETSNKKRPGWDRTIFCIVDNADLEHAIQMCAGEINCEVLFDWPTSPELIFDHHFVAVVEAGAVDNSAWDLYVDFCNDGDIKVPCLLVGDNSRLNMPETNNIIHFDGCGHGSIQQVVSAIKTIRDNTVTISLI